MSVFIFLNNTFIVLYMYEVILTKTWHGTTVSLANLGLVSIIYCGESRSWQCCVVFYSCCTHKRISKSTSSFTPEVFILTTLTAASTFPLLVLFSYSQHGHKKRKHSTDKSNQSEAAHFKCHRFKKLNKWFSFWDVAKRICKEATETYLLFPTI